MLPTRLCILVIILAVKLDLAVSHGGSRKERSDKGSDPSDPRKRNKLFSWDFTILGHRGGSSGFIPEHSLMSYTIGAQHGADYLEPDVVFTSDSVEVLQHHPDLGITTNAEQVFGQDSDQYTADDAIEYFWRTEHEGGPSTHPYRETSGGYFSWDFSYADVQRLSLVADDLSPSPFDQLDLPVMTLEELLQLIRNELSPVLGRPIGIIPELKYPHEYTQRLGEDVELLHLETLAKYGYLRKEVDTNSEPFYYVKTLCELAADIGLESCDEDMYGEKPSVILQSFNAPSLQIFRQYTDAPLIYLSWYNYDLMDEEFVEWVLTFADGLGVNSPGIEPLKTALQSVDVPEGFVIFEYTLGFAVDAYFESIQNGITDGIWTDDSNTARCVQQTLDYIAEHNIKVKGNKMKTRK